MGWPEVVVLENALDGVVLDSGAPDADLPEETGAALQIITASELQASLEAGGVAVIDLATSLEYKASHIPGAFWAVRARLDEALAKAPADATLVFTGRCARRRADGQSAGRRQWRLG
jgi:rhodanese-related sulfurtransferase